MTDSSNTSEDNHSSAEENQVPPLHGEPELLPLLIVYDCGEGDGTQCFVADHHVFRDLRGFHTDGNLRFYSNWMHHQVLDEIGDRVTIYGNNLNSPENKVNTMIELFRYEMPSEGQEFRATIVLHPTM